MWCWRKLLRVSWAARRSNQSILKEINTEYSLKEWCWNCSSNTLATSCEQPTHWKSSWCWERLRAGGEVGDRGWDSWIALYWLNGHEFEQTLGISEGRGSLACCSPWGRKESNTTKQQWTTQLLISLRRMKRHCASKMKGFLKTGFGSGKCSVTSL